MKVQIISYENKLKDKFKDYEFVYSTINSPKSFDEFDVNIISLQNTEMWKNRDNDKLKINCIEDLKSVQKIIQNSSWSKTIIVFPVNCTYFYDYWPSKNSYYHSEELKNMLNNVLIL